MYPVPDGRLLRCRRQQAADCSLCDGAKAAPCLLDYRRLGFSRKFGFKGSKLGFGVGVHQASIHRGDWQIP